MIAIDFCRPSCFHNRPYFYRVMYYYFPYRVVGMSSMWTHVVCYDGVLNVSSLVILIFHFDRFGVIQYSKNYIEILFSSSRFYYSDIY